MSTRPKVELIVRLLQNGQVVGLVTGGHDGGWTWLASRPAGAFLICVSAETSDGSQRQARSLGRALSGLLA